MFHYIILCNICKFFFNRSRYLSMKISFINFFRNFAKFRPLSGAQIWLAIGMRFCNGCAGPIVFQKIQINFYRDRNGGQWRWSINLALSDRQCLVARILTQGVKRPSTGIVQWLTPHVSTWPPVSYLSSFTSARFSLVTDFTCGICQNVKFAIYKCEKRTHICDIKTSRSLWWPSIASTALIAKSKVQYRCTVLVSSIYFVSIMILVLYLFFFLMAIMMIYHWILKLIVSFTFMVIMGIMGNDD